MSRVRKDPLRPLSDDERETLSRVARSQSERAERVIRAKALLSVAGGASYVDAAKDAGLKCNDAVSHLVSRFNQLGLVVLDSRHGGGRAKKYGEAEKSRILREFKRKPDLEKDGTAKMLTLFHPKSGKLRSCPVLRATNSVLHPWLTGEMEKILAGLPEKPPELDDKWRHWSIPTDRDWRLEQYTSNPAPRIGECCWCSII